MIRLPSSLVPDESGFSLIGDPQGNDILRRQSGLLHGLVDTLICSLPYLQRIVFYVPCGGVDLLVFLLSTRHDQAVVVEDDRSRRARALVDGDDVGHAR